MNSTPKLESQKELNFTNRIRKSFGSDFVAKLKSERRFSFRDFRKKMGTGSASLRRYLKKKALENKKK